MNFMWYAFLMGLSECYAFHKLSDNILSKNFLSALCLFIEL